MESDVDPESAFERVPGERRHGLLILCDHASARVPAPYGDLGLPPSAFQRHIAYDIGARRMARRLASLTGAPALLTRFTRLLIDPNRGEDDPTLVMRLSDGAIVPGNAGVDAVERRRRIADFHRPYHAAIAAELDGMEAAGVVPAIVSLHSFTPVWKGVPRPWEVAVLWDLDPRLSVDLIATLRAAGDLTVGDNQPMTGRSKATRFYRHGTRRGLPHTLIEVRQDLIATDEGADAWPIGLRARSPRSSRIRPCARWRITGPAPGRWSRGRHPNPVDAGRCFGVHARRFGRGRKPATGLIEGTRGPSRPDMETAKMVADIADSGVAADELKQFIERIERLEEEKKAIADDVKDVYAEAKGRGYDTKAIRAIVRLRAKEPHEREEEEAILELYKSALGMA